MTGPRPANDFRDFMQWMREHAAACDPAGASLAVLFVDYDVVARLDSAQGFEAGNAAHWCLVERMRDAVLRPQDAMGEIARGQMVCGLHPIHGAGVARLAANKALQLLGAPIPLGESQVHARPAIGIALCPDHGSDPELLLRRARIACRTARDRFERIAEYSDDQEDPRAKALLLENRLRDALAAETLEMAFQPRIELQTRRLVGVECLLHWPERDRPAATPAEVLATVESAELANEVAAWLLHASLRNGGDFLYRGLHLRIGLKLPARCLRVPEFPDLVDRALHTWPVQRGQLLLGFASLARLGAQADVVEALQRLRRLGARLSMENLGTGDASLHDLAGVIFDELRLKLGYLPGAASTPRQEKILRALVALAHNLNLIAVAEGVDDEAVADRLAELGCDQVLGAQFGEPLEAAQFIAKYEGQG
ncbi:MAG: GGDEF domain-containing protein [Betaproteobacteria bacterium]|nr:MAG: GGDEF domain-containing protein [Betaproteobacteria bacterium]